ncbi:hypothetical protein [Sanguibacter sp. 25GB23B1]|uniref:hypothetical protein n=1 Tax=unclassified Sanguibacter TaxID=2645534 RepID=UPI0032AEBA01
MLEDVLRELRTGASATTIARRLGITDDLADTLVDHWVEAGQAQRPPRAAGVPLRASERPDEPARTTQPCPSCAPRPRWLTPTSCHGCPFAGRS